jgi:hypothetical protein
VRRGQRQVDQDGCSMTGSVWRRRARLGRSVHVIHTSPPWGRAPTDRRYDGGRRPAPQSNQRNDVAGRFHRAEPSRASRPASRL